MRRHVSILVELTVSDLPDAARMMPALLESESSAGSDTVTRASFAWEINAQNSGHDENTVKISWDTIPHQASANMLCLWNSTSGTARRDKHELMELCLPHF